LSINLANEPYHTENTNTGFIFHGGLTALERLQSNDSTQTIVLNTLALLLFRALARLPLALLQSLGSFFGALTRRVDGRYRHNLRANLAQAGLLDHHNERRSAREAGKSAFELPFLWLRPAADTLALTSTRNWHLVEQARAQGRGIIFLTPHLGCFEVTAQYIAGNPRDGAPITVLYREPRKAWLRLLVESSRGRHNLTLARADLGGVRRLVRALRRGEAVGLLPDQVPGQGEGVWAPFFGRPAYTMTLPARLQEMSGAVILFVHGERLPNGTGWVMHVHPFDVTLSGDAQARATQVNGALEQIIRQCPQQYFWGYNRYKVPAGSQPPAEPGA
jgi:KDO2-lipid IV(A) lauroyltransferase